MGRIFELSFQAKVAEFHAHFDVPNRVVPQIISRERQLLRENLIEEELIELQQASMKGDLVEIADALGDLLYVVYGAALEYGIYLDEVGDEIHRSNMTKLDENGKPRFRSDGKILKGPNYDPPDIKKILLLQGYEALMPEFENEINVENGPDTIDDDDDGDIQTEVGDVPNYDEELGEDSDD